MVQFEANFKDAINSMDKITIRGARTHNLQNLNLSIPRNQLVVITGRSGSGKSSLIISLIWCLFGSTPNGIKSEVVNTFYNKGCSVFIDFYVDDEISIGDYVMSSGEVACEVVIDTVYRLVNGVISSESLIEESYSDGLLEYPQYTRPPVYNGMKVPEVLLSGNHENIRKWRLKKRIQKTLRNRPDLIWNAKLNGQLSLEAQKMIEEITENTSVKNAGKKSRKSTVC